MRVKSSRGVRIRWYSAIGITAAGVLLVGGAWFLANRFWLVSQPAELNQLPLDTEPPGSSETQVTANASPQTATPPQTQPVDNSTVDSKPDPAAITARQGVLRVSNPTEFPVRVALLSRKSTKPIDPAQSKASNGYDVPAHWDFAPQEGGTKGLIVSLPDRRLKVKKGDVLVAFAQDGSRRYWGPYVVGETESPVWSAKAGEWQLSLQP